jgi:polysaccharide export outer membrane protein
MQFYQQLRWLFSLGAAVILFAATLPSCTNTRTLIYMQGQFDTAKLREVKVQENVIQKGDILSIIVYSDNPEATKIYNQQLITAGTAGAIPGGGTVETSGISGNSPSAGGYLVDENGNIEFQGLGLLHVDSLTKAQLKDTLNDKLKNYLTNPYVTVRFQNYRFTMLGEVSRPGIFSIPGDHLSLLQALGMAGDMTFYGRRDNILVIRETNGIRQFARLDITKPEIMASPFFYLQSNDVVIVEPTKKKVAANDQTALRNVSIAASVISTLALLYSIFK